MRSAPSRPRAGDPKTGQQEALTNTHKHAGRAIAGVTLAYGPESLRIDVRDDGNAAAAHGPGSGYGLIGMRECSPRGSEAGRRPATVGTAAVSGPAIIGTLAVGCNETQRGAAGMSV
ncbi:ATP-binding protein [Actinacidiphila oryziradicis]|uniref:histidine kinase n=1 Tax=Actinacidiphila oryziradicis TaxID=2571141 RepID=A0A4U0RNY2_9ACTN|nr:hypothetical protein [Actinacidiphila oryziradicis]TJZ97077.1 hypothetical protein FCI23_50095 [Actinacidiphila oryziradicis]